MDHSRAGGLRNGVGLDGSEVDPASTASLDRETVEPRNGLLHRRTEFSSHLVESLRKNLIGAFLESSRVQFQDVLARLPAIQLDGLE